MRLRTLRRKETLVSIIPGFHAVAIAELGKKSLERRIILVGNFEGCQHSAEIRAVIPIVKQADVPAAAERIQELEQGARALGKLEAAHAFILYSWSAAADHVSHVQLRDFVIRQVGRFITVFEEI